MDTAIQITEGAVTGAEPATTIATRAGDRPLEVVGYAQSGQVLMVVVTPRQAGTPQLESPDRKFQRLSTDWVRATGHLSNFDAKVSHLSYLKIIGMGWSVVPILLRELKRSPGHWFTALHIITEADPVDHPSEDGDIEAIARAWVRWGERRGYSLDS